MHTPGCGRRRRPPRNASRSVSVRPRLEARRRDRTRNPRRAIRKLNLVGLAMVCFSRRRRRRLGGDQRAGRRGDRARHHRGGVERQEGPASDRRRGRGDSGQGGREVEAGQIVLRLDDTVTRATLGVVRSQLDELMAREARLLAEREDADVIVFPNQLTSGREREHRPRRRCPASRSCSSRAAARAPASASQLRERVAQTNEEIRGLSAQHAAKESELELIAKELVGVAELYKKNLVSISRFTQLQRDQTRLQGERGQFIADIARARGKISETELQIIQLDQDFRTEVLKDLREVAGQDRRAQGAGHRGRGPAQAHRPTLAADRLRPPALGAHRRRRDQTTAKSSCRSCRARTNSWWRPRSLRSDIDQIATGAKAIVKVMAGNQRTTPEIIGVITRVSADLAHDPQQQNSAQPAPAYYTRPHLAAGGGGRAPQGHPPRSRHAGRGLHPDPRAHAAAVSAQAAARPGRAHLPRALIALRGGGLRHALCENLSR